MSRVDNAKLRRQRGFNNEGGASRRVPWCGVASCAVALLRWCGAVVARDVLTSMRSGASILQSILPSTFLSLKAGTYMDRPCFSSMLVTSFTLYLFIVPVRCWSGSVRDEHRREKDNDFGKREKAPVWRADIRDPRRAASPRQMQRSRIPLSSPISVCI